ncbi:MAG: hypothetical protein WC455_21640 [Dehalococcoidia bacterium]|jgi:hypothetical protein
MTTATANKPCAKTGRACSYWGNGCLHPRKDSPKLFCKRTSQQDSQSEYAEDSRQLRESGSEPFLGMDEE